jgi:hypothetical protein
LAGAVDAVAIRRSADVDRLLARLYQIGQMFRQKDDGKYRRVAQIAAPAQKQQLSVRSKRYLSN